ncbi:trypsin-like peptidase domain-containing protein [Methylococcus mesophilus]|uniref:trypsin-like peptidase domain-containing protein n=1 Tax=Methylococcus mesophilus TaxID=2993564 RepID=UPI00224AE250|nr:trypsin-like peptidase domain-containing protein [Methylococcus mesophilus]UZR29874.1 trypsin-like peptidase domain-containing protein [Methylococcus mesophilus]
MNFADGHSIIGHIEGADIYACWSVQLKLERKMPRSTFVDPLSATSLLVIPCFNDIELASATGFTVSWNGAPYLITNWHVVTGRNSDTEECLDKKHAAIPNRLTVRFHAKGTLGKWTDVDLPLIDENQVKMWKEHPLGNTIDVVAISLSEEVASQVSLYPLDLALADVDMVAMPALPVSVIGYPFGICAGENWPIWKTGHIASDPDIDFETGRPAFLIDATTRSGMSGSPVVLRMDNYTKSDGSQIIAGGIATKFMGVYAGRVHEESEIGRVWRPFVLSEIILGKLIFNESTRRIPPSRVAPCPCGSQKKFKECCGVAL